MTQDIAAVTKTPPSEDKDKAPVKEFWIVEVLKKLLDYNMMKYGTKKKF